MPPAKDVLLHYYPGWNRGTGTPVLLVHGTVVDATSAWISPHAQPGLAPYLAQHGARVFALTFANRQGDNLAWAEQINDAIARIRAVTGANQVDVISHSKGTVAARALASRMSAPYLGSYRGDIRRLVLIASPLQGMDNTYRHASFNLGLYPEKDDPKFNAPLSWDRMLVFGQWVDTRQYAIVSGSKGYFAGQAQLLARWDKVYPVPEIEQDWYTTYYGGQGFISSSSGIDAAIAAGGHFMDQLKAHPLDPSVQVAVLSGDRPDIPGIMNEMSGPSDGIVFVKSATATEDLVRGGARLVAKSTLHMNHMDLIITNEAHGWVANALAN
jgi:pimeloyl-ACP methyl ester carboxylesterase